MQVTYRFSCTSAPETSIDTLSLGPFIISISKRAAHNNEQSLSISFDHAEEAADSLAMSVEIGDQARRVRGSMTLPRFDEVKEVVSALQGLLTLHIDLEVNFRQFQVSSGEMQIMTGPSTTEIRPRLVPPNFVADMAEIAPKLVEDEIVLTFWRLGFRSLNNDRPLEAFYHFWYFIERKFAAGKWRFEELVSQLLSSDLLLHAISFASQKIDPQTAWLLSLKQREVFLRGDHNAIVRHLVKRRGDLHHAKPSSEWHPGDPDPVRADAAFLGMVCQMCVALMASGNK